MAQGPDGKTIIIVKKVVGHGGHHGGSWKVAYADFVTSMMAFFMVLWLVNSASVPVRERIASYFRAPGVFEKGSGTPVEVGGAGILPDTFAPPAEFNSQTAPNRKIYLKDSPDGDLRDAFGQGGGQGQEAQGKAKVEPKPDEKEKEQFERLAKQIEEELKSQAGKIASAIGMIDVKVDQRGLHVEIMDTPTASMFARGSAGMLSEAEPQLRRIAEMMKKLPNPVDIEGHTDSAPYKGRAAENYDNWNLSMDRANAARRAFERAGVKEQQIARVVGYAAQRPKIKENPLAAANRRISISMRYTEQARETLQNADTAVTQAVPIRPANPEAKPTEKKQPEGTITRPSVENVEKQPARVESTKPETTKKELKVEVTTSLPEEAEVVEKKEEVITPGKPVWMEKDKIFGDKNPFFGQ